MDRGPNPFGGEWTLFVESVASAVEASLGKSKDGKLAPYYEPYSIVKRMTYAFVARHTRKTKISLVETAIDKYRDFIESRKPLDQQRALRRIRKPFKGNSYYWIMLGLDYGIQVEGFSLGNPNVTKFAEQLKYAHRHHVPVEYLIGFLLQTGTAAVSRNAKNPDLREDWFVRKTQPA